MTNSEIKARTGESVPVVQDVKQAVGAFVTELKTFQSQIETKLQQQEERLTMMDRKSHSFSRTRLETTSDPEVPHQKAFHAYLRSGDDQGLRGLDLDAKSMSTAVNSDGGYLVDPQTAESIQSVLQSTASVRAIASVVNVESLSFDVLVDHSDVGTGWSTENADVTETDSPQLDRISIPLHELSALPKASQRLLDDSAFDIEAWLAERIADRFARAEAAAFVNGDGVDKPTGFLTHPSVDNDVWAWGSLGYVPSGQDADFENADALVDLVYGLGAQYRANASFVMNSKTAGLIRKLKDNDGRFIWADGLAAREPARLLGYPVLIAEDMPDVASDSFAIAFGDFKAGYTVAERPDLRVLRDPFSAKPNVLFYATKRVGGDVSDFAAIKLMKFAEA